MRNKPPGVIEITKQPRGPLAVHAPPELSAEEMLTSTPGTVIRPRLLKVTT